MRFICLVLLMFLANVNAGDVWLKDIVSPKGWDLGHGVILKLNEEHKGKNISATDRLSLDLNLGGLFGVSVAKAKSEGVELDFYVKKNVEQEGRAKKGNDRYVIPMMIGYKAALVISVILAVMKMMTFKAMFLAKLSLIISFIGLLMKLKNNPPTEIIEFEHGFPSHPPPYFSGKDQAGGGGYYGYGGVYPGSYAGSVEHFNYGKEAQASNIYQDIAYAPTAAGVIGADSSAVFSAAAPNESVNRNGKDVQRREDRLFKNSKDSTGNGNMLFIKKYASIKAENR